MTDLTLTSPLRILIADDHPDTAEVLATVLHLTAPGPVDTVVVHNGLQAVHAASHEAFDTVLLDLEMPLLDGMEAASVIRALHGARAMVIIALSGNSAKIQAARSSPLFDEAFIKPLDMDAFLSVVFSEPPTRA